VSVHVRVTGFDTGYCTARASLIARGTGWREVRCHAPAFLLQHPQRGALLFDAGYAPRLADAWTQWPERIYGFATPTVFGTPMAAQLHHEALRASDVRTVIVSHLHADHVAGLRDFPQARFVISREALALRREAHGLQAVRRGIVQAMFPDDFDARAIEIPASADIALPHLGLAHDLFGDGSILLVPLPGHARGQIGAFVHSERGPLLLCADGAWTTQAYTEHRPPHWITSPMQDDAPALERTLKALRDFSRARPDVTILPTHCPTTLRWMAAR
jgi:glyoxylase-like metal-dependent hydrolase (beta-lactamase superfamily II)